MSLELWISMAAEKLIQDEHPIERHRFTGRTESLSSWSSDCSMFAVRHDHALALLRRIALTTVTCY